MCIYPQGASVPFFEQIARKCIEAQKKQILYDVLQGSKQGGRYDIDVNSETAGLLMDVTQFRKVFSHGKELNEGFYAFRNYIQSNEKAFRSIIFKFKLIGRQLDFVLHAIEVRNQQQFDSLKWLEESLFELDELHADYDNEKILCQLIWALFAGWSMIDGYRDYDPIEKAISTI